MKRIGILCLLSAAVISWSFALGNGDNVTFPGNKQISLIVPYSAGGASATTARIYASELEKALPGTITVSNITGASGATGLTRVKNAKPDGYTIGFINLPTFSSLSIQPNSPFTKDSIVPICNHLFEPSVVVVRKNAPWKTIEELIEYCKAHKNEVKCSTNGVKASNHIGAQLLAKAAGFEISCIPYGGTADQLLALRQGEVDMSVPKSADVAPLIGDNGELKVLATYTENRLAEMPDVPTLKEKGYNLVYGSARALVAPKGTPQAAIDFYVDAFEKTINDPDNIEKSKNAGLALDFMSPDALGRFMDAQEDFVKNTLPTLFN